MSATDTDVEAIGYLDWEVRIRCTGRTCTNHAAHLVRITPGPDSHPHDVWYPTCGEHVVHLRSGHAKCIACHERIALVDIKDL